MWGGKAGDGSELVYERDLIFLARNSRFRSSWLRVTRRRKTAGALEILSTVSLNPARGSNPAFE